jgi:hypothetical protein
MPSVFASRLYIPPMSGLIKGTRYPTRAGQLMKKLRGKGQRRRVWSAETGRGRSPVREYSQSKRIREKLINPMRNYLSLNDEFSRFAMESLYYICYKALLDV